MNTDSKAAHASNDSPEVESAAKPKAMLNPISRLARHFGNGRCKRKKAHARRNIAFRRSRQTQCIAIPNAHY
jgi:hypothetical protein